MALIFPKVNSSNFGSLNQSYNPSPDVSSSSSFSFLKDDEKDSLYGKNVGGGQSTMLNGQPVQLQPNGMGTNNIVSYNGANGVFGNNSNLAGYQPPVSDNGFGLDLGTFNMVGNALGGIGSLAKGYAALKGLGLAKKELAFKREAFDKNFGMQRQAYDDSIRQYNNVQGERQAFVNATHANPSLSNIQNLQLPSA